MNTNKLAGGNSENLREAAVWFQDDAEYLYRSARKYRDNGDVWMAVRVQQNAAHSAQLARDFADDAAAGAA